MSDYIKRADALEIVNNNLSRFMIALRIGDCPSADVAPVRHGRWDRRKDKQVCSLCGAEWYYFENDIDMFGYCPRCGALMDGGDD